MYKFRAGLEFPALLRYSIGMTTGALLPFAFACFVERGNRWRAGIVLLLILLLYPITLTKLTLFMPCWLLFLLLLSRLAETRTSVILSLLLPMLLGVAWMLVSRSGSISSPLMQQYVGIVNSRMIAMPSIALEVYNNFFSTHDLTHFCQINVLKPFVSCPYGEPLSIVMDKAYTYGAFNASLFATEGIASVGLTLAPLSALACGLVIALSNRLSSGLPQGLSCCPAACFRRSSSMCRSQRPCCHMEPPCSFCCGTSRRAQCLVAITKRACLLAEKQRRLSKIPMGVPLVRREDD